MNIGFAGYLLKINGRVFPNHYIAHNSYAVTPSQRQDLDSYRDALGVLHRTILQHKVTKIEFSTVSLHLADKMQINRIIEKRDEVRAEYWNDETNSYVNGTFYIPDIKYEIYGVDEGINDIRYNPVRISLIEY